MKASMDRVCRLLDEQQRILNAIWDEERDRIQQEQALFRKQLGDVSGLHADLAQIICISEHLHSFVTTGAIDRSKAEKLQITGTILVDSILYINDIMG